MVLWTKKDVKNNESEKQKQSSFCFYNNVIDSRYHDVHVTMCITYHTKSGQQFLGDLAKLLIYDNQV